MALFRGLLACCCGHVWLGAARLSMSFFSSLFLLLLLVGMFRMAVEACSELRTSENNPVCIAGVTPGCGTKCYKHDEAPESIQPSETECCETDYCVIAAKYSESEC